MLNDYIGRTCPFCNAELKDTDDIVVCSECDAAHHKDCWVQDMGCAAPGCFGTMPKVFPRNAAENAPEINADNPSESVCQHCGATVEPDSLICFKCGGRVRYFNEAPEETDEEQEQDEYYNAPKYSYNFTENDRYRFIKENADYYFEKFRILELNNSKISWNWSAFLFPQYWLFYRKIYKIAWLFLIISLASGVLGNYNTAVSFTICISMGLAGNYIYMDNLQEKFNKASTMSDFERMKYVARNSGTSKGAVWIAIAVTVAFQIITRILFS